MPNNPIWGFMGGVCEFVPQGKTMINDEVTGQPREVVWSNHMRFTCGRRIHKLRKNEVEAIANLFMKDKEFKGLLDECL